MDKKIQELLDSFLPKIENPEEAVLNLVNSEEFQERTIIDALSWFEKCEKMDQEMDNMFNEIGIKLT